MSVKNLIILAPVICGAFNAAKHSKLAELAWDHEQRNNGFPRLDNESAAERIAFLFDWPCVDEGKRDYIRKLVELNVLAHYGKDHGDKKSAKDSEALAVQLSADEINHQDVSSIISVESAARGNWF